MLTKDFDLSVKDVSGEGTFEGYASTFGGSPDSYGDVIAPGAFAESLAKHRREGTMPLMLFGHQAGELPIGNWLDMAEDGKGLWVKGQLALDDPLGSRVHSALKNQRVRGMSIGYETKRSKPDDKKPGARLLEAVDLWEVSVVNFPANRRAKVDGVKSDAYQGLRDCLLAGDPPSLRVLEKGLRDAFALSHAEAERAVRVCFKEYGSGEPGKSNEAALSLLRDAARAFNPRT